jgi:putative nucleotidyltransferase with HDIG domain
VLFVKYLAGTTLKSEILWEYPAIVSRISALSGTLFSPALVRAFEEVALRESFWLALDPSYIEEGIAERLRDIRPIEYSAGEARAIAQLFAQTADAKSMYTLEHSTRVAEIARYLAETSGIEGVALDQVEIAALLHDVGKLRLPEELIDKPSELTREERALIRRHSFDTARILNKVFPGQPIAEWASLHHENLLGTGYPYHSRASDIPREARLIAVADIFQALSQERPYRKRLAANDVVSALEVMRAQGRIDSEMVALVRANIERCYALAVGSA